MEHLSSEDLIVNRNLVIGLELELFKVAEDNKDPQKHFLHLGCGSRILNGFINVDKYYLDPSVINYDIFQLPFEEESVHTIFCAHVLEHLPIRHAKLAIKEWARVLKRSEQLGGIYIGIPDLELIIWYLLDPNLADDVREWLMYCLFGFQTNPANREENILDYPVDIGQFHTCGFTKKTITQELESNGFTIQEIFSYDGWGTPSIWVKAYIK